MKQKLFLRLGLLPAVLLLCASCASSGGPPGDSPGTAPVIPGFVRIEGGTFQMGGTETVSERPVHMVTLSGFSMAKYPVTQKEWTALMGEAWIASMVEEWKILLGGGTESGMSAEEFVRESFVGDNYPAIIVNWYEAVEYCNILSEKEGLIPAYTIDKSRTDRNNKNNGEKDDKKWTVTWNRKADGYRLPTEAEWEYAARGGNGSPGNYTFPGSNDVDEVAWYLGNSENYFQEKGLKKPNGPGLYDMGGNVWEWCWDWYGDYGSHSQRDPTGPSSGEHRITRGGSYVSPPAGVRSADRNKAIPSNRYIYLGFRLVRS